MKTIDVSLRTFVLATCTLLGVGSVIGCAHTPKEASLTSALTPATQGSAAEAGLGQESETKSESTEAYVGDLKELPNRETDLDKATEAQLPKDINDSVLKWISYFEGKGRPHMERYLARSTRYMSLMKDILKKEGMPEDLIYMALIESGFNGNARSHAGAVGYWQFIRDTGRLYDLKINRMLDERKDPIKSTQAAARYMRGLYNLFGSWYLAIAAYNVGENKVKRVVMKNFTREFWELAARKQLPRETIDYIPKYIAAKLIAKDPLKYGFDNIEYAPAMSYDEITTDRSVDLQKFAEVINISFEDMKILNPSYRTQYAPVPDDAALVLRVPSGSKVQAEAVVTQAHVTIDRDVSGRESTKYARHKVRRGENLVSIAQMYETSVGALRRANRLGRRHLRVRVGTSLRIPTASMPLALTRDSEGRVVKTGSIKARGKKVVDVSGSVHVVRRGDTLSQIARRYRIRMSDLASINNLGLGSRLNVGRRLTIPD